MANSLYLERYRVYTRLEYFQVYQRLKGLVFNEYHTLFSLCVFLGYRNSRRSANKGQRKELFWSHTFSVHELAAFYALLILENESGESLLKDGEKALEWLQGYADGGMEILLDSEIFKNVVEKKGKDIILDVTARDNLQKQMMYYVFSLYREQILR